MRTKIAISIVGLVMVAGTYAHSDTKKPDELALTTPISAIKMDQRGNITGVTFDNGVVLEEPQIKLEALQSAQVTGIRPLPLQCMEVSSSSAILVFPVWEGSCPACACRNCGYRCCRFELEKLSESIVLHYNSEGQMYRTEPPSSEFPEEGVSVLGYRSYALIEYIEQSTGETKFGVLAP